MNSQLSFRAWYDLNFKQTLPFNMDKNEKEILAQWYRLYLAYSKYGKETKINELAKLIQGRVADRMLGYNWPQVYRCEKIAALYKPLKRFKII